jgi:hypothetical protein
MPADDLAHIRERLSTEGDKVAGYFAGLPPEAWDHPVYTTGPGWKVRQILAHFVTAERGYLHYMRDRVSGGPGVPRDFDIDAFNREQVERLAGLSDGELLSAFGDVRRETIAFVAGLKPQALELRGHHPWFGEESLGFLLRLIYRHPMLHLRDIRLALETGGPLPHGEGYARFSTDGAGRGF